MRLFICSALLLACARPTHAEGAQLRIAVLYFDNNTGQKKLDVLQKGFADMLITDLAAHPSLVVVERDKLQALLGEIKLQRKRYFDKRTAIRLGKGLGAQYVISGAFARVEPQMRVDIRMIRVRTGAVVLAAKVSGSQGVFELEQTLVAQFLAKLNLRLRGLSGRTTRVPDVKALIDYSKAIDLADRGKLRSAELWISAVMQRAPRFRLARLRARDFKRRLANAAVKRTIKIGEIGRQLIVTAESFVKNHRKDWLDRQQIAQRYLTYRMLLSWVPLRLLRGLVSGRPALYLPRDKPRVLRLLKAHLAQKLALIAAADRFGKRYPKAWPSFQLSYGDRERARAASFGSSGLLGGSTLRMQLASFLLLGSCSDGMDTAPGVRLPLGRRFQVAPPLGVIDKRYARLGFKAIEEAIRFEDALAKRKIPGRGVHGAIMARELYGRILLAVGRRDKAIEKWQEALEKYPTSRQYKRIENLVKEQLGLRSGHIQRMLNSYAQGLKTCRDMSIRAALSTVFYQRLKLRGYAALRETIVEIEKACRGKPRLKYFWPYLYKSAAIKAGARGNCKLFDRLMKRALTAGLSPRDAAGYRRNYSRCP